jgi:plastocyanin
MKDRHMHSVQVGLRTSMAVVLAIPLVAASAGSTDGDVDQKGLRFTKPAVAIPIGGTVHFHNSDDVIHNIMTIDANDEPEDQGLQKPGETISTKFDKAGDYQVRCAIHPKMKMTVKVGQE